MVAHIEHRMFDAAVLHDPKLDLSIGPGIGATLDDKAFVLLSVFFDANLIGRRLPDASLSAGFISNDTESL